MTTSHHVSHLEGDIFLRRSGTPKKGTLWCIHGFGDSGLAFEPMFRTPLIESFELIVPDLPGFGLSAAVEGVHTISSFAKVVSDLICQVSPDQPYGMIGHSLGAPIAAEALKLLSSEAMGLFSIEGNLTAAGNFLTKRTLAHSYPNDFKRCMVCDLLPKAADTPSIARYLSNVMLADAETYWRVGLDTVERSETEGLENLYRDAPCRTHYHAGSGLEFADVEFLKNEKLCHSRYSDSDHWPMLVDSTNLANQLMAFFCRE